MGSIYQRGEVLWIKYYKNGKAYRESSKSSKIMVAKALLKKREGEIAQGKMPGIVFEKVKFDELAEDLRTDYRINQRKSIERVEASLKHLKEHFEGMPVVQITSARIKTYIQDRMEEGAAHATINRELAALKRMLSLGARCTPPKVDRVPYIAMLKENNVRTGFFEHADFVALRDALPSYMKPVVTFGYKSGWRKSEITALTWSQVDLNQGAVYLNPGETKNDDGRTAYMDAELKEMFAQQWKARKESGTLTPYAFPNETGKGKICDFRGAWNKACVDAKIGNRLFHDFRRTAVRNMVRAGVPEAVAMRISGHRTRSVFDRYNIVSDKDLRLAAQRQEDYLKSQLGTKPGTIVKMRKKKGVGRDG